MIAAPWYLFSLGVVLIIVGLLLGGLPRRRSDLDLIDPKMDDEQIVQALQAEQAIGLPNLVAFLGLLCILVSLVWRLVRFFF